MLTTLRQRLYHDTIGGGLKVRLIRGALGSAGIQAANRVLSLALSIVLARTLGVEGYGVYAYAFAIMSLLMVASEAGVPTLLMREVAASQGRRQWGLLSGALRRGMQFVGLAASTVSLLGLIVLWWFAAESLRPEVMYTTALMLLALPVLALCKTVAHALHGLHRVVVGQAVDMLIRPLLVLIIVGVVFMAWPEHRQPHFAMAAQLFAALLVLLIAALVLRHFLPDGSRAVAPEYKSREWLKSALPFTLINGALVINNYTDIIMLGWFTGTEEVGIYRVAVQGATLVAFGLQVVSAVVAPHFARLYAKKDMERLQRLVTQSARIILLAVLPLALIFIFWGAFIVAWVFGAEFATAHGPLMILVIGQLVLSVLGISGPLLSMVGFELKISRAIWISSFSNILLNLIFIPVLGMFGAAISTAITIIGWHVYLIWLARTQLGITVLPFTLGS